MIRRLNRQQAVTESRPTAPQRRTPEGAMPRKKTSQSSDDLAREIERLQRQRAQVETAEHARRGELIRRYLSGPQGDQLRQVLDPLVAPPDRQLFGLTPAGRSLRTPGAAQERGQLSAVT
jgi:hypothetical protein